MVLGSQIERLETPPCKQIEIIKLVECMRYVFLKAIL